MAVRSGGRWFPLLAIFALVLVLSGWATNVSAQPLASPVDSSVPPTATATTAAALEDPGLASDDQTADDDISANEAAYQIVVYLQQCGTEDTNLQGTTVFRPSSDLSGADTSYDCLPITGWTITLTNIDNNAFTYTRAFAAGDAIFDYFEVEEGSYTVSVNDGVSYTAIMPATLIVEPWDYIELRIVHYVAGSSPPTSVDTGTGQLNGTFYRCQDASRANQTDFQFLAAAQADECWTVYEAEGGLYLTGIPNDGSDFEPRFVELGSSGEFSQTNIPYGTYELLDLSTGDASGPFQIDSSNGGSQSVQVYNYYAEDEEELDLPYVQVHKIVCADSSREGDVDFLFATYDQDGSGEPAVPFGDSQTCIKDRSGGTYDLTLKSSPPGAYEQSVTLPVSNYSYDWYAFPLVPVGNYTIEETYNSVTHESPAFFMNLGEWVEVTIVNYVADLPESEPQGTDPIYFYAELYYCTNPDRTGEVDFVIDNQVGIAETTTGDCLYAVSGQGMVVLYHYATPDATEPDAEYPGDSAGPGGFYFDGVDLGLFPGWYQLGLRDSGFPTIEVRSDIFQISAEFYDGEYHQPNNQARIFAFTGAVPGTDIWIEKSICHDPAKAETTDFFINQFPPDNSMVVVGAETTNCQFLHPEDAADYVFTLTDTATGETLEAISVGSGSFNFLLPSVPAGTYTLTEAIGGGIYTATSDEFTVDPSVGEIGIAVHNYTAIPLDVSEPEYEAYFEMWAFTCASDIFETRFDYYYYPEGYNWDDRIEQGSAGTVSGAAAGVTEYCRTATPGEYQFELESVATGSGLSAQETFSLTQDEERPGYFYYYDESEDNDNLPIGTYIIRELVTGSESDPVVIGADRPGGEGGDNGTYAEFYFYPAAPTPTPTATATATATATSTATATATATSPGTIPPGAAATATDRPILPGRTPTAGSAPTSTTEPGKVSVLPSTGQGQTGGDATGMILLLGMAVSLLLAAAMLGRRKRA